MSAAPSCDEPTCRPTTLATPGTVGALRAGRLKLSLPSFSLPARKAPTVPGVARVVGLHVGSSQLGAALIDNNGSAELVQLARTPLDYGIVSDGEVRDPGALANAL